MERLFKIFIVEDDPWYGEILKYHLSKNPEYEIARFSTAKSCIAQLHLQPQLITLDYSLPDGTGADVLKKIRAQLPHVPVIIISAQNDVGVAVELMRQGATDYLVKDDTTKDRLWHLAARLRFEQGTGESVYPGDERGRKADFSKIIHGSSAAIQKIFVLLQKAAGTNINVSITGETGTGKEVIAKAIHDHSDRRRKPLVVVNMAAIPKDLIESELFGHEKGAFTGAVTRRIGRFEEAHKGTLFLDEIAELEPALQSKLLRVLQERELTRVGGSDKISLDVRLIVATHKSLPEEVREGRFREDLYYRTLGLPISLPPLRDRGNDVLILAKFFLVDFCKKNNLPALLFSAGARERLMQYHYPGNVRELKAIVELACVMCEAAEIAASDFHFPNADECADTRPVTNAHKTLKEYTTDIITNYLHEHDNNVQLVADKLGIGKSTIYKMIQNGEILQD